jgi:hypothetical protein
MCMFVFRVVEVVCILVGLCVCVCVCVCAKMQFVCGNFINIRTVYEGVLKVPHMFVVMLELICICEDSFCVLWKYSVLSGSIYVCLRRLRVM